MWGCGKRFVQTGYFLSSSFSYISWPYVSLFVYLSVINVLCPLAKEPTIAPHAMSHVMNACACLALTATRAHTHTHIHTFPNTYVVLRKHVPNFCLFCFYFVFAVIVLYKLQLHTSCIDARTVDRAQHTAYSRTRRFEHEYLRSWILLVLGALVLRCFGIKDIWYTYSNSQIQFFELYNIICFSSSTIPIGPRYV